MPNTNTTNKEVASTDTTCLNHRSDNNSKASTNQGNSMFINTEPWPEIVNGAELADSINAQLNKYIYLPDGASEVITMWILHTYNVYAFDFSPRLCIISPEKRCGKTTLLRMIEHLSYRSLNVSNVTTAALFRAIDAWHPTMLIDEADTFIKNNEELRGIINAGFQKDGKVSRIETIGKTQNVKCFNCFAAVGIAAIGSLPCTILDRSIIISMRRKKRSDTLSRLRTRDFNPIAQEIRSKCLRFMSDNAETIVNIRPEIPECLNDRAADAWEPLFAIAEVISPDWRARIEKSAIILSKSAHMTEEASFGDKLLADIREIFTETSSAWIASDNLVDRLRDIKESPWADYNHKGLNAHSLAQLLKYYNIFPQQQRVGETRNRGYDRKDFNDAFERYLPPLESAEFNCATVPPSDEIPDLPY